MNSRSVDRPRSHATVPKLALTALGIALAAFPAGSSAVGAEAPLAQDDFVKASGTSFTLGGKPFLVTGVNNHYLTYGTADEVGRVLDDAVALGANVVRTFLQPVTGSLDGSVPTIWDWQKDADSSDLGVKGAYLLYWDSTSGKMAINGGPNGMGKVDTLIAEANIRKLRLIIAFLDFWSYTGGAQQMRAWYGSRDTSGFFFSDPRTKHDYKTWVSGVLHRVNPRSGLAYSYEPTIMAWELMNEPNAEPETLRLAWIDEMSGYVKTQDPNHLVSSGHANVQGGIADLSISTVDFGTWHGYPLFQKLSVEQFGGLIRKYCGEAAVRQKPVLLEEFGYARSNPDQAAAYARWLETLTGDRDCAGWLVWRLVSRQASGEYPVDDYDQFDIRNDGSAVWNVVQGATANRPMRNGTRADIRREHP
jgi:mannan endo-1,4-beta-mannosidase